MHHLRHLLLTFVAFAIISASGQAATGFITLKNKSGDWEDVSVWNQTDKYPNDVNQHNAHIGRDGNVTIAEGKSYSVGILTLANNAFPGNGTLTMMPGSSLTSKAGIIIGNRSNSTSILNVGKDAALTINTSAGIRMALVVDSVATLNIDGGSFNLKGQKSNFIVANAVDGKTEATLLLNNATVVAGNRTALAIGVSESAAQTPEGLVKVTGNSQLTINIAVGGKGGGSGRLEFDSTSTLTPNSTARDVPGLQINASGKLVIKQLGDSFNTINLSKSFTVFEKGAELILDGSNYKGDAATLTLITLGRNASGQNDLALKTENFPNHKVVLSWSQDGKTLIANISKK